MFSEGRLASVFAWCSPKLFYQWIKRFTVRTFSHYKTRLATMFRREPHFLMRRLWHCTEVTSAFSKISRIRICNAMLLKYFKLLVRGLESFAQFLFNCGISADIFTVCSEVNLTSVFSWCSPMLFQTLVNRQMGRTFNHFKHQQKVRVLLGVRPCI